MQEFIDASTFMDLNISILWLLYKGTWLLRLINEEDSTYHTHWRSVRPHGYSAGAVIIIPETTDSVNAYAGTLPGL